MIPPDTQHMTIRKISQIYGIKVNKLAFLEWCVAHPESEWTMTLKESERLDEYIQYIQHLRHGKDSQHGNDSHDSHDSHDSQYEEDSQKGTRDHSFDDHDWEIFGCLSSHDGNEDIIDNCVVERFGLYVPTHDQQEAGGEDVVIVGVTVSQIYSNIDTLVLYDTQLPFQPSKWALKRAGEILDSQPFTSTVSERSLYLVQDFCFCCT